MNVENALGESFLRERVVTRSGKLDTFVPAEEHIMAVAKRKPSKRNNTHSSKGADAKRTRRTLKDLDAARKVTGGRKIIPCI